jgi:hypothetical protein
LKVDLDNTNEQPLFRFSVSCLFCRCWCEVGYIKFSILYRGNCLLVNICECYSWDMALNIDYYSITCRTEVNPCGGGVEYLHRDLASRKRRRNGTKKGRAIA